MQQVHNLAQVQNMGEMARLLLPARCGCIFGGVGGPLEVDPACHFGHLLHAIQGGVFASFGITVSLSWMPALVLPIGFFNWANELRVPQKILTDQKGGDSCAGVFQSTQTRH